MGLRVPDVDDEQHRRPLCSAARCRRAHAKLYVLPGSHPCAAVEVALKLKSIAYKRVDLLPMSQVLVGRCATAARPFRACASAASGSSARARSCAASTSSSPSRRCCRRRATRPTRACSRPSAGATRSSRACRGACIDVAFLRAPERDGELRRRRQAAAAARRCMRPALPLTARLMALQEQGPRRAARADIAALPGQLDRIDGWIARRPARRRAAERRRPADRQHDPAAADDRRRAPADRRTPVRPRWRATSRRCVGEVRAGVLPAAWLAGGAAAAAEAAATAGAGRRRAPSHRSPASDAPARRWPGRYSRP